MDFASVDYLSASPFEGRGVVEDVRHEDGARGVDVTPAAIEAGAGEPFGKVERLVEVHGDDEFACEVYIPELSVLLDEGEAVVVDVFVAVGRPVVVFKREDDAAVGVDDAVVAVDGDNGASVAEHACFVVDAGYHLVSVDIEETVFATLAHSDATFAEACGPSVDEWCERFERIVEEGHSGGVAGEEDAVGVVGYLFVAYGEHLFA